MAQLRKCRKYLQASADLYQSTLQGKIIALEAKLELHLEMGHPWISPDPSALLLFKSQHKAVCQLLRLGLPGV